MAQVQVFVKSVRGTRVQTRFQKVIEIKAFSPVSGPSLDSNILKHDAQVLTSPSIAPLAGQQTVGKWDRFLADCRTGTCGIQSSVQRARPRGKKC